MARTITSNGRRVANRRQNRAVEIPAAQQLSNNSRMYDWSTGQHNEVLLSQLYSFGFGPNGPMRTIGLSSAKRGEGVTTVACNLALYAADCHGLRVLLVDANHANPKLHSAFRVTPSPGLVELLYEDDLNLADCIHDLASNPLECWPAQLRHALRRNRVQSRQFKTRDPLSTPQLSILPAGCGELLARVIGRPRDDDPFDRMSAHFDLVIVDLPATESPRGCGFPLTDLDGILLVLKAQSTADVVAQKALRQLSKNDGKVLGIVFNQCRTHLPRWIDKRLGD